MIEEGFKSMDYFMAIEMGLYFIVVGYYFLLFSYFLLMRFRTSKKLYWLFFSILFLCLAAGRAFFIGYYFFVPELNASNAVIAQRLMLYFRLATFFSWMGIACAMGVLGILLFPPDIEKKKNDKTVDIKLILRIALIGIPIMIGILVLTLPDEFLMDPQIVEDYDLNIKLETVKIFGRSYPVGRFILNFILTPIFIAVIPFLFVYLAFKTYGVLRKSYALNALGFFLYYMGRLSQGIFEIAGWPNLGSTVPALLIICSLLIIVIANNYEQLR